MWCDFCNDRIVEETVKVNGKYYDICKSCASMCVTDKEE